MPSFSVIIPCYNQAHFLPTAVESVLAQGVDAEVVVVDDGSHDDTSTVAKRLGVRTVRQANAGLSAARNRGILESSGDHLLFLDSDDFLRPRMLQAAAEALDAHPAVDVLHGVADAVDERTLETKMTFGERDLGTDPFHSLLGGNVAPPCAFVMRRDLLPTVGLFDTTLRSAEDWDMWLRVASVGGTFLHVPAMRSAYRDVAGSMSKNSEVMWRSISTVAARHAATHQDCAECRRRAAAVRAKAARSMRSRFARNLRASGDRRAAMTTLARNPGLAMRMLKAA
ncbi:glycosyltransferase [Demequina iriomotensis]|uniref:glycosyltransferase n=1 Tax=Demequina iriomotensis TaxID=1536641 RepID=UPI00078498DA|nr:glycosyltransferase [Demequina iriomotensis]